MKKRYPKVSVIMPAYNAEKYISRSIESILNQTFKNFELIIIDDNSQDKTWAIIKKYAAKDKRIRFFRNNKNLKLSHTLNRGIKMAVGKYLARMDADDISLPDRLEKQVLFMEGHPKIGISGGSMEIIDEADKIIGRRIYHLRDKDIRKYLFKYSPFSHPLVIIRKSVLDEVGGYNHEYNPAEDYELYFRLGKISKFGNLHDVLLKYRVVKKSMTTGTTRKMEIQTIKIRREFMNKFNYQSNFTDQMYTLLHAFSVHFVPPKFKIWLFNKLRNT